ncbi:acyltransferase domain-containing protein [Saxibacter everestensis]|uniref:Acyltransferase domain-containing protein n=1 Tax=Saxibacter everestensis TaxID=2909229 RepID=A0ABY8QX57_9MICO|nr:acyltransferase domain-containing protein [Brevibacteriaceae bacterium ZFBP1038]
MPETLTPERLDAVMSLFDLTTEDELDYRRLLTEYANRERPAGEYDDVRKATDVLRSRLGTFPAASSELDVPQTAWLVAFALVTPDMVAWRESLGIPDDVTRAGLSDMGLQLTVNRRVHGRFGLDTCRWMTLHFAGHLFRFGRLQYLLHSQPGGIPGKAPAGAWVLGLHIPEAGPLTADGIDESLEQANEFFARYFPERDIAAITCESWLLDPYLSEQLPGSSNIARFAARFNPYGESRDQNSDAIYFVFRTRELDNLAALPRDTSLQRVILDRIAAGGNWQVASGYLG